MANEIKIGRAGRDSGLPLLSPERWDFDGDRARISGNLIADDIISLLILRGQVNRLGDNPDEPFVPAEWTGDATVNGFYRVLAASVPMPERGIASLRLRYELELERVPDFHAPMIEHHLMGALRTNSHSVLLANTVPWHAVPADTDIYAKGSTVTQATRAGAEPALINYVTDGSTLLGSSTGPTVVESQISYADWYDSSARVETNVGGGTYRTLVGRQLGPLTPAVLRLSNGHMRVSIPDIAYAAIDVAHHDGTQWETAKRYKLADNSFATNLPTAQAVRVIRNSPEECVLRFWLGTTTASLVLTCSLRRGSRYVACRLTDTTGTDQYGVYRDTAEAASTHTSGVHATAADAADNFFILTTPNAKTNDLTQGGFYLTSGAASLDFMISSQIGTGAAGPDTFTNLVFAYMAAQHEAVHLSRR